MKNELSTEGCIRIKNENDRSTIATILYNNGYTVQPVRRKKDGRSYEYYVRFELKPMDDEA